MTHRKQKGVVSWKRVVLTIIVVTTLAVFMPGVLPDSITGLFHGSSVQNIQVEQVRLDPQIELTGWTMASEVLIYNPNNRSVTIESIEYRFFIEGNKVALANTTNISVNANATKVLNIHTKGAWTDSIKASLGTFGNYLRRESTKTRVEGRIVTNIAKEKFVRTFSREAYG